jgi:hypothetical protein
MPVSLNNGLSQNTVDCLTNKSACIISWNYNADHIGPIVIFVNNSFSKIYDKQV